MSTGIKIRGIEIGNGMPGICVPVTESTREDILRVAGQIVGHQADMVEWRMDFYRDVMDISAVSETLRALREVLGDTVLLATFRTAAEGGEKDIKRTTYVELNAAVAESGCADLVDIEVFRGVNAQEEMEEEYRAFIGDVASRCTVVGSYHDFEKTPPTQEMERRLLFMKEMGVHIPKLAVMPQNRGDVMRLLQVTRAVHEKLDGTPIITMSMGSLGVLSRISGYFTGSAVTFGCLEKSSAPGQLPVEELRTLLEIVQKG